MKSELLQRPRIKDLRIQRKILHVAGDHGEAVALGGGHQQSVHHRHGLPGQFLAGCNLRPDVKRGGIERQDASGEALFHRAQPGSEFLAAVRIGFAQLENAFFNFFQDDALGAANREIHGLLRDGIRVEIDDAQGVRQQEQARLLDFNTPDNNRYLAVTQLWIKGERGFRRPDVLLYVNGIPLCSSS